MDAVSRSRTSLFILSDILCDKWNKAKIDLRVQIWIWQRIAGSVMI